MEEKKVIVSVNQLGDGLDIAQESFTAPDGRIITHGIWTKENYLEGLKKLYMLDASGADCYVTDSPAPWLTAAYANELSARSGKPAHYLYPTPPTPELQGWDVDLTPLKTGSQEDNYDVVFEVIEDGDNVYVNMNSDKPSAAEGHGHTFDPDNLDKVLIPQLPKGKHVFYHAKGMFCVMIRVALSFAEYSKSVSIAAHEDDYTCCVSHCDDIKPGDVTKRTIQNNL